MIHGSAFSDDHSATLSFIPSLAVGVIQSKENQQMEHNGQDLSQGFWQHSGGKWRRRCLMGRFSEGLAGAPGKWTQSGTAALIQSDGLAAGV